MEKGSRSIAQSILLTKFFMLFKKHREVISNYPFLEEEATKFCRNTSFPTLLLISQILELSYKKGSHSIMSTTTGVSLSVNTLR